MNLSVGQTVYLTPGINTSRRYKNDYQEGKITKIGRKYVTVNIGGFQDFQFDLTNEMRQKSDYTADWVFYETSEEIVMKKEIGAKYEFLRKTFSTWSDKLNYDKIRRIYDIVKEEQK